MHKFLISHQHTSELMSGFEESVAIRRQELTKNKTETGIFIVKNKLSDLFGFAKEKVTYGLGYTLTLKRNKNNNVIFRAAGVDAAKRVTKDIGWYIPHFTPSLENQQIVMNQLLNKDPTELFSIERLVFRKDVSTNNNCTFDLGKEWRMNTNFRNSWISS